MNLLAGPSPDVSLFGPNSADCRKLTQFKVKNPPQMSLASEWDWPPVCLSQLLLARELLAQVLPILVGLAREFALRAQPFAVNGRPQVFVPEVGQRRHRLVAWGHRSPAGC
jgi:hypothetical protein